MTARRELSFSSPARRILCPDETNICRLLQLNNTEHFRKDSFGEDTINYKYPRTRPPPRKAIDNIKIGKFVWIIWNKIQH